MGLGLDGPEKSSRRSAAAVAQPGMGIILVIGIDYLCVK